MGFKGGPVVDVPNAVPEEGEKNFFFPRWFGSGLLRMGTRYVIKLCSCIASIFSCGPIC